MNSPINPFSKPPQDPLDFLWAIFAIISIILFVFFCFGKAHASESWKITAYCACHKCCGKTDGITASGKKAQYGMVACNWLKFGTKVKIEGLGMFVVADRGAKTLFGDKTHHLRHLDVFLPTHTQALKFGVQYKVVEIL